MVLGTAINIRIISTVLLSKLVSNPFATFLKTLSFHFYLVVQSLYIFENVEELFQPGARGSEKCPKNIT